jgi:glycine oxidase
MLASMKGIDRLTIAVVGGGVAGLGAAWRLAQAGAAVTVFDAGQVPSHNAAASWASAGMICARLEMARMPAPLAAFALSARAAWPAFAAELERNAGMSCGFRENGAVHAFFGRAHAPEFGPGVERIDRATALRLEPGLADDVSSALWAPGEALADPRWLILALVRACRAAGARIMAETRVNRLLEDHGRVTGVLTAAGAMPFDHVVVAAGAWTTGLLKVSNLPGPRLRPVKGELLSLDAATAAMPAGRLIWTDECYIVPHADGRIVIGATQLEAGFDATLDHDRLDALRRSAERAVPALAGLTELERVCGFRPASDDGLPVLGGIGPQGLTLASGQFRNGILFAPLIADCAAQHTLQGRLPDLARPFAAARFAEAAA